LPYTLPFLICFLKNKLEKRIVADSFFTQPINCGKTTTMKNVLGFGSIYNLFFGDTRRWELSGKSLID